MTTEDFLIQTTKIPYFHIFPSKLERKSTFLDRHRSKTLKKILIFFCIFKIFAVTRIGVQ